MLIGTKLIVGRVFVNCIIIWWGINTCWKLKDLSLFTWRLRGETEHKNYLRYCFFYVLHGSFMKTWIWKSTDIKQTRPFFFFFFFFNWPLVLLQIWEPWLYYTILRRLTHRCTRRIFLFSNTQKIGNSELWIHVVILLAFLALTLSPFAARVLLSWPWFSFLSSLLPQIISFAGSDGC